MGIRQPVCQRSGEPKLANGKVAQPAFLDLARPAVFGRLPPVAEGRYRPNIRREVQLLAKKAASPNGK
jgi:hypothetical protein